MKILVQVNKKEVKKDVAEKEYRDIKNGKAKNNSLKQSGGKGKGKGKGDDKHKHTTKTTKKVKTPPKPKKKASTGRPTLSPTKAPTVNPCECTGEETTDPVTYAAAGAACNYWGSDPQPWCYVEEQCKVCGFV